MADTTPPTIAITSNKTVLNANNFALLTFTLSEAATDFSLSDITITGGTLSNFFGSGMVYQATFNPSQNSTTQGSVSVGNYKFSDAAGNANVDRDDDNNKIIFVIDTISPNVTISSNKTYLGPGESAIITFSLNESAVLNPTTKIVTSLATPPSYNYWMKGGELSALRGSGSTYTAEFTPYKNINEIVSINNIEGLFSDIAGNIGVLAGSLYLSVDTKEGRNITREWIIEQSKEINNLSVDASGNVYFARSESSNGSIASGIYVTKHNNKGDVVYNKILKINNEKDYEYISDMHISKDGSLAVVGQLNGIYYISSYSVSGDLLWSSSGKEFSKVVHTEANEILTVGFKGKNLSISSFASNGVLLWESNLALPEHDRALISDFSIDTYGNIIFVGQIMKEPLPGWRWVPNDVFVVKTDSKGTLIWSKTIDSGYRDDSGGLSTDNEGNVYVIGSTNGDSLFEALNTVKGSDSYRNQDAFLIKYNSKGDREWTKIFGNETGSDVVVGSNGYIYAVGSVPLRSFIDVFQSDGTKIDSSEFFTPNGYNWAHRVVAGDNQIYLSGLSSKHYSNENTGFVVKYSLPDISLPKVSLNALKTNLILGESIDISITLSKSSTNFTLSDIVAQGGIVRNFHGSGKNYTVTFTAGQDASHGASVAVTSGKFSDALSIFNEDGADADNLVKFKLDLLPVTKYVVGTTGYDSFFNDKEIYAIDGGDGNDTVVWSKSTINYQLTPTKTGWQVMNINSLEGSSTLVNVEKLHFSDKSVIVESKPHGSYADLPVGLYQFFITAFNAAPGVTYMDQLAEAYRYGLSVKQIVNIFTTKSQFTDVYPTSMTNAQLAQALVNNIVKTSASDATKQQAVKDITDAMTLANWTVGQVIFQVFGNLANFAYNDPMWGNTAKQFANQIEVAKIYTDTLSQSTTDLATLRSVMAPVSHLSDVSTPELQITLIGQALMG